MEEEASRKTNGLDAQNHQDKPEKAEAPEKDPNERRRGEQKGVGWPVWLLVLLIVLLLASSIANLIVSHRGYESSRKQITAIEQLMQSIKDTQRAIMNLGRMLEQSRQEEEESEEDKGSAGDGSI